jgi:hypothetical protein
MEVERDVIIEQETGDDSATDRQSSYTTFIGAASSMPMFTDDELDSGLEQMTKTLAELAAESAEPFEPDEPAANEPTTELDEQPAEED